MTQLLETRQLQQITVLARRGSFASAARKLGLSQPALTRSIQGAERDLGVRLFDRHARGVTPTPVGEALVARAREILSQLADLHEEIALMRGLGTGVLRVGASPSMRSRVLPEALARLCRRHPQLTVEVRSGTWAALSRALLDREIDIMLGERSEAENDARFEVFPLPSERVKWFVRPGHPLAAAAVGGTVPLAALAAHAVALPIIPSRLRKVFGPLLGAAQGPPRLIRCADVQVLRTLAAQSDVVVLLSDSLVEDDLERGRLVELPVEEELPATLPGAIRLRGRSLSPAGAAFLAELGQDPCDAGSEPAVPLRDGL